MTDPIDSFISQICRGASRRKAEYVEQRIRFWMKCGFPIEELGIMFARKEMDEWIWLPDRHVLLEKIEVPS